jgi:quinolinate synthase
VKNSNEKTFIVATESGILHQMQKENPNKQLIAAPMNEDSTCACNECPYMKMNTMEKLYLCMLNEKPEIIIGDELREKALVSIDRMLALS